MKTFFKNLTFTFLCLGISTILAFFFFNLGQKNSVNTALIYILALILIAQNTTSYWYGAAASVFCVIAANYFFTYPYFKLNFILDGYPVTFIGMLAISLITSATASMLKKQYRNYLLHETGTKACRSRARENSCQSSARRIT